MDAHVDVELTFKSIKHLLDVSEALNRVQRLHTYSTIKTLCDCLESTIKDEDLWAGNINCLFIELLCAYGSFVGVNPEQNSNPLSLAQTALSNLMTSYISTKNVLLK